MCRRQVSVHARVFEETLPPNCNTRANCPLLLPPGVPLLNTPLTTHSHTSTPLHLYTPPTPTSYPPTCSTRLAPSSSPSCTLLSARPSNRRTISSNLTACVYGVLWCVGSRGGQKGVVVVVVVRKEEWGVELEKRDGSDESDRSDSSVGSVGSD